MSKPLRSSVGASVPENLQITHTYVFFLIAAMQIGVGILSLERVVVQTTGYDGWISIFITGMVLHVVLWMMYHILADCKGDIVTANQLVFGKYIGGILSLAFSLYILVLTLNVLVSFIEIIRVWVFPSLNLWIFVAFMIALIYYFVVGGFRVITGLCLMSILIGLPILWLKFFPTQAGDTLEIYPIITHSLKEILQGSEVTLFSFLGMELLLIYYPFIKNPQASKKWAHYGVFFTTMIYVVSALAVFIYYSEEQIRQVTWPTISTWKIVQFPFIERFEFIGIAMWMFVIMPNICLGLWGSTRLAKRVFNINQTYVLVIACIVLYLFTGAINERMQIKVLSDYTGNVGMYVYLYIPVLFILMKIKGRWRKMIYE
ncbi:GerAB/ArcD/ProY family transporter [Halobacillus locisalis]|uniref:GerAB/ArcD/ProY family transporter n=1 Tax=Halobacillus locisalis TaxID=220753 RepID=A0A838CVW3_9BACI|nr:GerAB/ArcD/ProY family transporter [Halobacillus locisalis]MBA2175895.1 GerAB/ArcD/ProY family transporter [Halobacillus locisalis]